MFRLNADIHGDAAPPWTDLASAQEALGDMDAAIASLERALEIAPEFPPARAALDRLRNTGS